MQRSLPQSSLALKCDKHIDMQGLLDSLQAAIRTLQAQDQVNNPTDSGIAMTVKVNTASQKALAKLERKAARKRAGKRDGVADIDYARTVGWAALQVLLLFPCPCWQTHWDECCTHMGCIRHRS